MLTSLTRHVRHTTSPDGVVLNEMLGHSSYECGQIAPTSTMFVFDKCRKEKLYLRTACGFRLHLRIPTGLSKACPSVSGLLIMN